MSSEPVVVGVEDKQPVVLEFAVKAAVARGATLRVVHCAEPLITGDVMAASDTTWAVAGQGVLDDARDVVAGLHPKPHTEYVLTSGEPGRALRDEAEKAALLVVGTDSPSRMERFFDGAVAAHVAKHSAAPVAIVPERTWPSDDTGAGVFVALDALTLARGPLRFAFVEASRRDRQLHVVHVVPVGTKVDETPAIRAQISEILAGWSEEFPDVTVTRRLAFDYAEEGCLRASEEADLLVVGRQDDEFLGLSLLRHPVLTQIARRAHCPCVVVPDEWTR
jgi:nucleotide-binding universal stress UspA family protein